jgi:hypothetical protein
VSDNLELMYDAWEEHILNKRGKNMELVVERISQTGKSAGRGLKAGGVWYSAGKFMKGDFTALHPGDVIQVEANGTFINGYKLVSNASQPTGGGEARPSAASNQAQATNQGQASSKDLQISRGAALKAILESPFYMNIVKDMGKDEAEAELMNATERWAKYMREGV